MINLMKIAERRFTGMKEISSAGIVLSEEVRKMCRQNTCGFFGKNWTCPPAVEPLDAVREKIDRYNTVMVVYRVHAVESSFDWQGMKTGAIEFKDSLLSLKRDIETADPDVNFMILGMGACHLCDPCAYVDGDPCRNPDDAIVSLEACGIDVMCLMQDHGMKYYHGKNTVTFIGGVFYNKA